METNTATAELFIVTFRGPIAAEAFGPCPVTASRPVTSAEADALIALLVSGAARDVTVLAA